MEKKVVQKKEKKDEKKDLEKDLGNKLKVEKAFTKLDKDIFDMLEFSRKYGGW